MDNFDNVSSDTIPDSILQVLSIHLSLLGYFEERTPRFVNITENPNLTTKPIDNGQPIIDSEDEKIRKQNKRVAKRKAQLNNLYALMRAPTADSAAWLLSSPTLISCLESLTLLLSCPWSPTYLSPLSTPISHLVPTPIPTSLALLFLLLVLGPAPPYLASSVLRIFKQVLSDKLLYCCSTSLAELFCPFPLLSLLPDKTNRKRIFDIVFINSRLLASNYAWEEVDLSFPAYKCIATVKLKRLWQLELLNLELVCIMEAILPATTLFWDLSFVLCCCYTMKLACKLGLRTWSIINKMVKEKIELV